MANCLPSVPFKISSNPKKSIKIYNLVYFQKWHFHIDKNTFLLFVQENMSYTKESTSLWLNWSREVCPASWLENQPHDQLLIVANYGEEGGGKGGEWGENEEMIPYLTLGEQGARVGDKYRPHVFQPYHMIISYESPNYSKCKSNWKYKISKTNAVPVVPNMSKESLEFRDES